MKHLRSPWRSRFFDKPRSRVCIFCSKLRSRRDARNYVLSRLPLTFLMLNLYPYNNGHVLVAPNRHVGRLEELTDAELVEMAFSARHLTKILRREFKAHGFNVGMNLGSAGGAGIPGHLHLHVVPRWRQDTNFMPVLNDTRVLSEALDKTYRRIRRHIHGHQK